jgi:hypothetical protein
MALPRFDKYLARFDGFFGHPARQPFLHLVLALLIYDGAKNLTGLNRATFNRRHLSCLDRFVTEVRWDENQVEQTRFEDLCGRARKWLSKQQAKGVRVPVFVCIDDTSNPKTSDGASGVSPQYNHLHRRIELSYCLVTAVLVVGCWVIPYQFQLYRRQAECIGRGQAGQLRDKLSLAADLIRGWQPFEQTAPIVVVDSWYTGPQVLQACQARGFTLIGGLNARRGLRLNQSKELVQVKHYQASLPNSAYHFVTVNGRKWQLASGVAELKGGWSGRVVLARNGGGSRGERCWWCSPPAMAVAVMMAYYSVRWEIELFDKHAKQLLGWCDNQCYKEPAVRRLWLVMLVAYSYLTIERVEQGEQYERWRGCSWPSLWQVQQHHKRLAHRATVTAAWQLGCQGVPLDDLLVKVRC